MTISHEKLNRLIRRLRDTCGDDVEQVLRDEVRTAVKLGRPRPKDSPPGVHLERIMFRTGFGEGLAITIMHDMRRDGELLWDHDTALYSLPEDQK